MAVMLAAGLVPVVGWALVSWTLADRLLAVSLEPLAEVLDRVEERLVEVDQEQTQALVAELNVERLQLAQAELGRRALRRLAPRGFLVAVVTSGLLAVVVAMLFARALARKLEQLADSAAQYATGELSHRMPEPCRPGDEVDSLIRQFNDMGARLEVQRRRLELTESLAAWQEVARTMAHDLKNPLTAMRLAVARLERRGELVEALDGEIATLLRMTESFAEFARLPAPTARPLELRALLEEVCALYAEGTAIGVQLRPGEPVSFSGDADQLRRAFGNLVKNALEASPPQSPPVQVELGEHNGEVVVAIIDHGSGIGAPLDGRQLLRTLGSSKSGGSGLGLPIVAKIILDHAGTLCLEPNGELGSRAVVRWSRTVEARA